MSKVYTDSIEKRTGGAAITVPASGQWIDLASAAQGDVLYHNGTSYVRLAPGTSGQYLQTSGAGANPVWGTVTGGLSRVDTWIMNTNFTATLTPTLLSNWTHSSDAGYSAYSLGNIGAAFTAPSTGVFTFPETGIWQVQTTVQFYPSGGYYNQAKFETHVTDDDGSTWIRVAMQTPYIPDITTGTGSGNSAPLDITDLANDKIKFLVSETTTSGSAVLVIDGSSSIPETFVTFVKIGDT